MSMGKWLDYPPEIQEVGGSYPRWVYFSIFY